jgi:cell division protein FtsZ
MADEGGWGDEGAGGGYGDQAEAPASTDAADDGLRMPEPYTPQLPETDAYAPPAGLYDDEGEEEYDAEEEGEDETAGGGFASLAGTRINRDLEGHTAEGGWDEEGGYEDEAASDEALELTNEAVQEPEPEAPGTQDELLLDADRLAEADQPLQPAGGRRRRMLGGGGGEPEGDAAPAPKTGGSTLFERMANLSRAGSDATDEEDEDSEGSSSLRIPRFLGRQNNQ